MVYWMSLDLSNGNSENKNAHRHEQAESDGCEFRFSFQVGGRFPCRTMRKEEVPGVDTINVRLCSKRGTGLDVDTWRTGT